MDDLDRDISDKTNRSCLLMVVCAIVLGVLAAWLISKGMGV